MDLLPEDEEWTEGCKFFCMLCSLSFTSFGVYKHHIGKAPKIEEGPPREGGGCYG